MSDKLHLCAGCRGPLTKERWNVTCCFAVKGFPLQSSGPVRARPCGTSYHSRCIKVGFPFRSRRSANQGLTFPKVSIWPNFVCEACTVRAVLKRELHGRFDNYLMCLERMRILDMAHRWSKGTYRQYQPKLRFLLDFGTRFGAPILAPQTLLAPPCDPSVPLAWALQEYSLQEPKAPNSDEQTGLKFQTLRALRSAASQFQAWDFMLANPSASVSLDDGKLVGVKCRATDSFGMYLMAQGMASRLGTESGRSVALLDQHIRFLDKELESAYHMAKTRLAKLEIARAGAVNMVFWTGWTRSAEGLGLEEADATLLEPSEGPKWDLPAGCGCLGFQLLEETKTARSYRADIIVAWTTASGLSPGLWLQRVKNLSPRWGQRKAKIFRHADGSQWTSAYFRHKFFYPSLRRQRAMGDPYLAAYKDDLPGWSLEEKFWSLHSYRRGSRSTVSRPDRNLGRRRATNDQVYEHARWERKNSTSEAIDVIYREWQVIDRIQITMLCM